MGMQLAATQHLGVVLGVPGLQSDGLQVQFAVQVHCGHDVLQLRHDARGVLAAVNDCQLLGACAGPCCHGCSSIAVGALLMCDLCLTQGLQGFLPTCFCPRPTASYLQSVMAREYSKAVC